MKNLERELLNIEVTNFGKFKNILFGAVAYILWTKVIFWIYGKTVPEYAGILNPLQIYSQPPSKEYIFVSMCIFAPIIEEIIYRVHLSVANKFKVEGLLTYLIIFSSVIFALNHPGQDFAVPVQGVAGLLFCYVYIKNGFSYISSVVMHFFINLYFFLL